MDDINTSLRNSTGKMPHATSHIQSVSRAIEMATTEILDLVDAVLHKLDHLEQQLKRSSDYADVFKTPTSIRPSSSAR